MSLRTVSMIALFSVVTLFGVLILSLLWLVPLSEFVEVLTSPRVQYAIRLSLITATIAMVSAVLIALPAAYGLSRYDFWGKTFFDTVAELPVILSPVALGAVLLIFLSSDTGIAIQDWGVRFIFEIPGIVLAQWTATVGVAIRLLRTVFDDIPQRYEKVAQTLGARPGQALRYVTLPLAARGIVVTALFVWAKALGEFGATITVAGSMAMKTETLPIAISNALAGSEIDRAVVLIFVLAITGLSVLFTARLVLAGERRDQR